VTGVPVLDPVLDPDPVLAPLRLLGALEYLSVPLATDTAARGDLEIHDPYRTSTLARPSQMRGIGHSNPLSQETPKNTNGFI